MECAKCKNIIEKDSKFCPNCGEKIKAFEIKEDIGGKIIADMEKLLTILEAKKKEENEKKYPCPFCNRKISIQALKSKLNEEKQVPKKSSAQ